MATQDADHILCERHTSPWHQLLITCHEMWHVLEDQSGGTDHSAALVGLEGTSLDDSALGRIMAARGPYDAQAEQDADLFASLLIAKLTRRVPTSAHGSSDVTMNRVERTLRGPGGVEPL
ncbi:hypothetical protein [Streptomyces buecherae]|uniref:hypothetical protein n=1 Tax=Streptomyces buecherae TaxID=2763006 RepID=UPI0037956AB9